MTQRVRAIAIGAAEMRAKHRTSELGEPEALAIAAASLNLPFDRLRVVASTSRMRILQAEINERTWGLFRSRRSPVRAVDADGIIRVQRSDAKVQQLTAAHVPEVVRHLWSETTLYNGDSVITPDLFVVVGGRVVDLSGITVLEQALAVAGTEVEGLAPDTAVALICAPGTLR